MSSLYSYKPEFYHGIALDGQHFIHVVDGEAHHVFKLRPSNAFFAIAKKYRFIDNNNPGKSDKEFRELGSKLFELHGGPEYMYVSGDMLISSGRTCIFEEVELFCLIGKHYGMPVSHREDVRIFKTETPCPAIERQVLLEEDKNRWDTVEIITTDPKEIHVYDLFQRCLKKLQDAVADNY